MNHEPWTHTLSATPQKTRTLRRRCCSRCCRTAKSCEKVTTKLKSQQSPSDYSYLISLDGFRPGGDQRGRSRMRIGSCVFAWIKSRRRRFKLLQIFGDTSPMFAYYYHPCLRHSFLCVLIYSTALFALLRACLSLFSKTLKFWNEYIYNSFLFKTAKSNPLLFRWCHVSLLNVRNVLNMIKRCRGAA